jgi:hypothetical protein
MTNAERAIGTAIANSASLSAHGVTVFTHGSYRNRINVRHDSDVDVGILCDESIFFDVPNGYTGSSFGIAVPAPYDYDQYRNDVQTALLRHFGAASVAVGNKAIDVHANTYRVDADVVPFFAYRLYNSDGSYREGRAFPSTSGGLIVNWPEQNYANGVAKNDRTNRGFKAGIRILKRLRNKMADEGSLSAQQVSSYLLACLAWNVPDEGFQSSSYSHDLRYILAHLFHGTADDQTCRTWCELNDVKYLFHLSQPWTRAQAHAFIWDAWRYLGFK